MENTGTIKDVQGLGGSIITLFIEDADGGVQIVYAEARLALAAFDEAFGGLDNVIGESIAYDTDGMMLTAFLPAEIIQ